MLPVLGFFFKYFSIRSRFVRWFLLFLVCNVFDCVAQPPEFWALVDSSSKYYTVTNDLPKALAFAEKARDFALKLYGEKNVWYASTYILSAEAYYVSGDFKNAVRFGEEHNSRLKSMMGVTELDSAVIDQYSMGLQDIAQIYSTIKRPIDAENACIECMQINKNPGSGRFYGSVNKYKECRRKLADVYFLNGKPEKSIPLYEEEIQAQKADYLANPAVQKEMALELCRLYNNLGFVHSDVENYHFAELALKEACYYGEKGLPATADSYNSALVNLATALSKLNQFPEAAVYFRKAEALTMQNGQEYARGILKGNMASMLKNLNAKERTEMRLEAMNLLKKTNSPGPLAVVLEALAQDYIVLEDASNAKKYIDEASEVYYQLHNKPSKENITELRSLLALIQKNVPEALRLNKLAISEYSKHNTEVHKVWFHRAVILSRLGKDEEANVAWKKTLDLLNERINLHFPYLSEYQREQFLDYTDDYRERYLSFMCKTNLQKAGTGEMYDLVLDSKAMLLNRELQTKQKISDSRDSTFQKKQERYLVARNTIAKYYLSGEATGRAVIDTLEEEVEMLEKELSRTALPGQRKAVKWQEVQAKLKPGEAAIEIVRFRLWDNTRRPDQLWGEWRDSVYYVALVVQPSSKIPRLVVLPNGKALEGRDLTAYRSAIERRTYDEDSYHSFWKPLKAALGKVNKVYFSPDGVYHQISLASLRNREMGRFLSEEVDIHLLGTTRSLTEPARESLVSNSIALYGFPNYQKAENLDKNEVAERISYHYNPDLERGGSYFKPLPATRDEVESIQEIARKQGWTSQLFIEDQASEGNIKNTKNSKVLHVATHGYFLKDTVKVSLTKQALLKSGLVMAGALDTNRLEKIKTEDGLLTAYEVSELRLGGTELVTLSACETGLGLIRNGNGVFGLQRAFLSAGAESVLMSLWKVNDRVTKELMEKFYQYWMGGLSKQAALLKSQEDIRNTSETLSHPYYWGGFVLTER